MAIPVITPITSILDYEQHQPWAFQPAATNAPTSWSVSPAVPPGMDFDSDTGKISGACTVAGIYDMFLTAINGDGPSLESLAVAGIQSAMPPDVLAVDVDIDLVTRIAAVRGAQTTAAAAMFQHAAKFRDDQLYRVRFLKYGAVVNPSIVALSWAMKKCPGDPELAKSSAWKKMGYGLDAAWLVYGKLDENLLFNELRNAPARQQVLTLEFEWLQANDIGIGPDPLRGTSQVLPVLVAEDYQQVPVPVPEEEE